MKTNGDMMREASDEELAMFLAMETFRTVKPLFDYLGMGITLEFLYAMRLRWVKQECGDDENGGGTDA